VTKVQLVHPETKETKAFWDQLERGAHEVHQVRWVTKARKAHKVHLEKKV
jgi:hypothetical protein